MATKQEKGKCDACGKSPRVLTKIESGQRVCRTCLREIRPPRPNTWATEKTIARLRDAGLDVPDDLSKEEGERLSLWAACLDAGKKLPTDTPIEELERQYGLARLQRRGIKVSKRASAGEVEALSSCWHFHSKLVGVTKKNRDGSDRQKLIRKCQQKGKRFEQLELENEEDNPVDPNAVAVKRANGDQLGYLNADLAAEVMEKSGKGHRYAVYIADIRGDMVLGVNILIVIAKPGATDAQAKDYLDKVVVPQVEAEFPAGSKSGTGCAGVLAVVVGVVVMLSWLGGYGLTLLDR